MGGLCAVVLQEGFLSDGRRGVEGVMQTLGAHLWGAEERGEAGEAGEARGAGGAAGVAGTRWWLWNALTH